MMIKSLSLFLFFCYLATTNGANQQPYIGKQDGLKQANKIIELPGQPKNVKLEQYSGYVTITPSPPRELFYYFVESPKDASKNPLVLWLNGGPYSSSLGYGAFTELGPFYVNSDHKTLRSNKYAWSNVANMLFLESPVGTGFSYSLLDSEFDIAGDKSATEDAYVFLLNWLERFPEYKNRDFYMAGESFAGRYIPLLANYIVSKNANSSMKINLKGVLMGNPGLDDDTNEKGKYDFLYSRDMISKEDYDEVQRKCDFKRSGITTECQAVLDNAKVGTGLDEYNIYAPSCQTNKAMQMTTIDPCIEGYIKPYFNQPEVKTALHANNIIVGLKLVWEPTSRRVAKWHSLSPTMVPAIQELLSSGLRTWIYGGDFDSVCPTTAIKYFLNKTGVAQIDRSRPWYSRGELGGFVTKYVNVTFVTVRAAGHKVPRDQPQNALVLFSLFLQDQFPSTDENNSAPPYENSPTTEEEEDINPDYDYDLKVSSNGTD